MVGLGVAMMPSVQVPVGGGSEDVVVDDDRGLRGRGPAFVRITGHSRDSIKYKANFACILPNEERLVLLENVLNKCNCQ